MSDGSGVSADTRAMMRFEAQKRSALIAYILWFFLGYFGAHRFYAGQTGSGVVMLVLFFVSLLLSVVAVGVLGFLVLGLWLFIDIFLIPGMVERYNNALLDTVA